MRDLYDLMSQRRSIRRFATDPVPQESLERVLRAASLAPSGANRQPWRLIVVDSPELKQMIRLESELADERWNAAQPESFRLWLQRQGIVEFSKPFLTEAPQLLCVFGDTKQPYWLESTWLAIAYTLLAVELAGLGTVTYTPGYTDFLNRVLHVPAHFSPQVVLPLGYPAERPDPASRLRRPLDATVSYNRYTAEQ